MAMVTALHSRRMLRRLLCKMVSGNVRWFHGVVLGWAGAGGDRAGVGMHHAALWQTEVSEAPRMYVRSAMRVPGARGPAVVSLHRGW